MLWLVVYDVRNRTRLRKVAKIAESWGNRVQKSVFEAELSAAKIAVMVREIHAVMDLKEDNLRIYRLCRSCRSRVLLQGCSIPLPAETFEII